MKFLHSSCCLLKTLYKATTDLSSTLLSGECLRDNFTAFGVNSANLRYLESLILNEILSLFPLNVVINEIQSLSIVDQIRRKSINQISSRLELKWNALKFKTVCP